MSVKYFCDGCGVELAEGWTRRVMRLLGDISVEVVVGYQGRTNAGHVCDICVFRVLNHGKWVTEEGFLEDVVSPATPGA